MKKGKFEILKAFSIFLVFCFSFFVFNFVSAGNLMLNTTSGSVGIGTATPGAKLDVRSLLGDAAYIEYGNITGAGQGLEIYHKGNGGVAFVVGSRIAGAGSYITGLTVLNNGKVGIGISNPGSVLEIKTAAASNTNLLKIGDNNKSAYLTAGSGYFGVATNDGVNRFAIDQDTGNISLNGKNAFNANDSWLRINDPAGFISGVYLGSSTVRTDGKLEVGASGSSFFAQNGSAGFNGTVTATTFIGALNGNAATATSAGNSDTVDGLHIHLGRNNEANKVVRTDGSGYLQVGYINSSSGDEGNNLNPAKVWGTNGTDSYLRTYNTSALSVNYAATAGTANSVAWANISGKPNTSSNGFQWNWDGSKGGTPPWLWGGSDGVNMYVYNPANFSVNYANSANTANSATTADRATTAGTADYSRYVYNNGAYSGSGWTEPSDLGVRYANSAGSAVNAITASTAGYASIAGNGVPAGAIMAFRLSSCPSGWSDAGIPSGFTLIERSVVYNGSYLENNIGSNVPGAVQDHYHAQATINDAVSSNREVAYNALGKGLDYMDGSGIVPTSGVYGVSNGGGNNLPAGRAVLYCVKD